MLDLHAHILPFTDDGARDFEMALDMLRMAEADGITHIVATPHYICGANRYSEELLFGVYNRINEIIADNGINIAVLPGNEVFLDEYSLEHLKAGKCMTLARSRYVLVEFSLNGMPRNAETLLCGLLDSGYVPVIAHAERYPEVIENTGLLYEFTGMGCVIQVNSTSITGLMGRKVMKTAMNLVSENIAAVVASDCHSNMRRSPVLSQAYRIISAHYGVKKVEQLFKINPARIIENKDIARVEEIVHKGRFRHFDLFNFHFR